MKTQEELEKEIISECEFVGGNAKETAIKLEMAGQMIKDAMAEAAKTSEFYRDNIRNGKHDASSIFSFKNVLAENEKFLLNIKSLLNGIESNEAIYRALVKVNEKNIETVKGNGDGPVDTLINKLKGMGFNLATALPPNYRNDDDDTN